MKKWAPFFAMLLVVLYVGSVAAQDSPPPPPVPAPGDESPPPADDEAPPPRRRAPSSLLEADDEELTDEKGMAPLAPFKAPKFKAMERFKRQEEEEERKEKERRASRPRSVPGAPTGEITPVTLADLKAQGESHINQLVLLKVYYMGKGSLKGNRFNIPRGKYNNIRVRDRDLEILNLIWMPKENAGILSRLKRNWRVTMVAKVIDVHTLTDMPILVVTGLKKGWQWTRGDFLPKEEEPPVASVPADAEDTPDETPGVESETPGTDTPPVDTPPADTPGSETLAEDTPPTDDTPPPADDDFPPPAEGDGEDVPPPDEEPPPPPVD